MTKIKLNNVEVDKAELVKLYKEKPELFKEEKPLGDDFSMLGYLRELSPKRHYFNGPLVIQGAKPSTHNRLNALIKIWEWKEKIDGEFGVEAWMFCNSKYRVEYSLSANKFVYDCSVGYLVNSELPYFSSEEMTKRAITELEQEYKIVFNVK